MILYLGNTHTEFSIDDIYTQIADSHFYKVLIGGGQSLELSGNKLKNQAKRLAEIEEGVLIVPIN